MHSGETEQKRHKNCISSDNFMSNPVTAVKTFRIPCKRPWTWPDLTTDQHPELLSSWRKMLKQMTIHSDRIDQCPLSAHARTHIRWEWPNKVQAPVNSHTVGLPKPLWTVTWQGYQIPNEHTSHYVFFYWFIEGYTIAPPTAQGHLGVSHWFRHDTRSCRGFSLVQPWHESITKSPVNTVTW